MNQIRAFPSERGRHADGSGKQHDSWTAMLVADQWPINAPLYREQLNCRNYRRRRLRCGSHRGSALASPPVAVAARNRNVADAQSRALSDAQSVRTSVTTNARYLRLSA